MFLRDIMGTRYLVPEYSRDLQYLIDNTINHVRLGTPCTKRIYNQEIVKAINEAVTSGRLLLDIADCRLSRQVWQALSMCKNYKDVIVVHDSEDEDRDAFLRDYFQFEYEFSDLQEVYLPKKPVSYKDLSEWVNVLRTDVVYKVNAQFEYMSCPQFLLAINLLRPDVKMQISLGSFMEYAKRRFGTFLLNECKSFAYKTRHCDECLYTRMNDSGVIHVTNIGDFDRRSFVTRYACMPAFIGVERFSPAISGKGTLLYQAVSEVMQDVKNFLAERPTTIESYFPIRKEYST